MLRFSKTNPIHQEGHEHKTLERSQSALGTCETGIENLGGDTTPHGKMHRKNKIVGKMGLGNHGLASTDNIRVSTIQVLASIWAAAPHRHSLSSLGRLSKLLI